MRRLALAALALALAAPVARADESPDADDAEATQETPADPGGGDTSASGGDPAVKVFGIIERMPPSAFPAPQTRGIRDGSLWMTFHGLQWPYYPKTGIGVSGYAWVDSGYERIERGSPTQQNINYLLQQGRVLLRVTPTYTDGSFFVQGQAELVANKDQSLRQPDVADTDDLWIKFGHWNKWDVQLGRYEGWEVYHMGMGLDLNTLEREGASDEAFSVPGIYGVTFAFNRPASVGQGALHLYPTDYLRVELGTQFGNEFGSNTLAARPVGVFDVGWLKVKVGAEYKKRSDQKEDSQGNTKSRGAGAAVQLVLEPRFEVGVNGAYGLVDRISQDGRIDEKGSNTTYSVGGFANARLADPLVIGAGVNYTYLEDLHYDPMLDRVDKFNHVQTFFAAQYLFKRQLYIKGVVAYAEGDFAPTFGEPVFENHMVSGRVRLMYLF